MRVLLDSCVWAPAATEVRAAGHDVACMADRGDDPGDEEVLAASVREKRILVTLDKDFGELVFVLGRPHCGILRLVSIRGREQGRAILSILANHGKDLEAGAIIVAHTNRIRLRLPE